MAKRRDINAVLDQQPVLRKPKGVHLSTDLVAEGQHKLTSTLVHSPLQKQKDPRPAKGFKIRTDIADAFKVLAAQHKRKLYLEMEEALLKHLREYGVELPDNP